MNINDIKESAKYIVFINDCFYQSTGYERPGEFGSKTEFVKTIPFDDWDSVADWIIGNPTVAYKVVEIKHLKIKTTVSVATTVI